MIMDKVVDKVVVSPNTPWGVDDTADDGRGFDCAPSQEGAGVCYEPQSHLRPISICRHRDSAIC
jgi:hypothetical protein